MYTDGRLITTTMRSLRLGTRISVNHRVAYRVRVCVASTKMNNNNNVTIVSRITFIFEIKCAVLRRKRYELRNKSIRCTHT